MGGNEMNGHSLAGLLGMLGASAAPDSMGGTDMASRNAQNRREMLSRGYKFLKDPAMQAECLRLVQLYNSNNDYQFQPGDLVTWKDPALQNIKYPFPSEPAMILAILPETQYKPYSGGPCSCEPSDMLAFCFKDDDGEWTPFPLNSKRMKLWTPDK